jgi:hypothetical protein
MKQSSDENHLRERARDEGFMLVRGATTGSYNLSYQETRQVALKTNCSLEEIDQAVNDAEHFERELAITGLDATRALVKPNTIEDGAELGRDLQARLIAAQFKRVFFPAPGDVPQHGFSLISRAKLEGWVEDAVRLFVLPGVLSKGISEESIAAVISGANYGSRKTQGDSDIAQVITIVGLEDLGALAGFGSVGAAIGIVSTYGFHSSSTEGLLNSDPDIQRALVARWLERVRAKPIPVSHPVWTALPPCALENYKIIMPQAPA